MHLTMHLRVATRSIFKSSQNQAVGKAGKSKFDDPQTLFSGCFGCFAALASRRALRRCSYLARRRSAFASKYRRRPNAVDFPTSFYSFLSRVHSKMPALNAISQPASWKVQRWQNLQLSPSWQPFSWKSNLPKWHWNHAQILCSKFEQQYVVSCLHLIYWTFAMWCRKKLKSVLQLKETWVTS